MGEEGGALIGLPRDLTEKRSLPGPSRDGASGPSVVTTGTEKSFVARMVSPGHRQANSGAMRGHERAPGSYVVLEPRMHHRTYLGRLVNPCLLGKVMTHLGSVIAAWCGGRPNPMHDEWDAALTPYELSTSVSILTIERCGRVIERR